MLNILYKLYYILVFLPIQVVHSVFCVLLCVLFFPIFGPDWVSYNVGVLWGRVILYASLTRVRVIGREHLESQKSYILIANHSSSFDVYAIFGWIGRPIRWVMKKELTKIPLFGWLTKASGQIAVDRSNSQAAIDSINEARKSLKPGVSVMIFPEGTRSKNGELKPFKKGAYHFAFDMRYDIVPIAIKGANKVKRPGSFFGSLGKIDIIISKPLKIGAYKREEMLTLVDKTKQIIEQALRD